MSMSDDVPASPCHPSPGLPATMYLEYCEDPREYVPGGFHFVEIGQCLFERYVVLNKLGFGGFSTCWLARDRQTKLLVAMKIGISDPEAPDSHFNESLIIRTLSQALQKEATLPPNLVPNILGRHLLMGPNGCHPCYVTDVARGTLSDKQVENQEDYIFEMHSGRSLAAQLALAVAFIHRQGVVHGDLRPANVLIQLPPRFKSMSDEELRDAYGEPAIEYIQTLEGEPLPDHIPNYGIEPMWLSKPDTPLGPYPPRIMLADFGVAFRPSDGAKRELNTPRIYRAPEARLEAEPSLSFPVDIWALACVIYEIFTTHEYPLFYSHFNTEDDVIRSNVQILGTGMPDKWWAAWATRDGHYNPDRTPLKPSKMMHSLERALEEGSEKPRVQRGMPGFDDDDEKRAFIDMLRAMLAWEPSKRLTAEQVLETEWMQKWALPAWEKDRKKTTWW